MPSLHKNPASERHPPRLCILRRNAARVAVEQRLINGCRARARLGEQSARRTEHRTLIPVYYSTNTHGLEVDIFIFFVFLMLCFRFFVVIIVEMELETFKITVLPLREKLINISGG